MRYMFAAWVFEESPERRPTSKVALTFAMLPDRVPSDPSCGTVDPLDGPRGGL